MHARVHLRTYVSVHVYHSFVICCYIHLNDRLNIAYYMYIIHLHMYMYMYISMPTIVLFWYLSCVITFHKCFLAYTTQLTFDYLLKVYTLVAILSVIIVLMEI